MLCSAADRPPPTGFVMVHPCTHAWYPGCSLCVLCFILRTVDATCATTQPDAERVCCLRAATNVTTVQVGHVVNMAHAVLAGGWVLTTFKAKRAASPGGCKATYDLQLEVRSCAGQGIFDRVRLGPAAPGRSCKDVRSWRSNGPEDARISALPDVLDDDASGDGGSRRFWVLYNDFVPRDGDYARFQFGLVGRVLKNGTLALGVPRPLGDWNGTTWGPQEKNWAPFVAGRRTYAHQWLADPKTGSSVAYRVHAPSGTLLERHVCAEAGTALRAALHVNRNAWIAGGTNAVPIRGGARLLALGHTFAATRPYRVYASFAYVVDTRAPFCVRAATPPFHLAAPNDAVSASDTRDPLRVPTRSISHMGPLGNTNIQFPMSLVLTSDETLQLAWGRGDRASHLSALHPEWLTSRLKHLHLRNHTRRPGFWFDDARIIEQDVPVRQFAGERYFTVVRDAPGRGWWLLSRRARALFLRWSSDGLEFSNRKLVLEGDAACNAAALQVQGIALVALRAIAARNPLVATNGTAFRGDWTHVLVVGGKSGDGSFAPHRRDGVRGAVAFDLDPSGGVLRETFTKPLFQGNGNGCVEGRGAALGKHDFRGWCEFDGRFSLVYWRDAFVLYARANVRWGTRSVQMTRSSDLETWDPWRLIDIDGSSPDADRNIYFFGVSANPVDADSLVAVLPVNHPRAGLSAICLTFSRDGTRWSPLVPLLATKPIGPRTADHPAIGIFSDGDDVLVYVQTNVPGIATQGASRLRRYAIPFAVFKATSTRALLD